MGVPNNRISKFDFVLLSIQIFPVCIFKVADPDADPDADPAMKSLQFELFGPNANGFKLRFLPQKKV